VDVGFGRKEQRDKASCDCFVVRRLKRPHEYIPILAFPNAWRLNRLSRGAGGVQEAFMNWDQIQVSWKQLKDKFVFRWFRVTDDSGKGLELIGAEKSSEVQRNAQPTAFYPDDREKRSEFSLHIGC
jgi:hypothetical protein